MNLKIILFTTVMALLLISCDGKRESINEGVITDDTIGIDTNEPTRAEEQKNELVIDLALINMYEIKSGDIATQKSEDQDLKDYGQSLMADHRNANRQLQTIIQNMNINLPRQLDEKHEEKIQKLQEATKDDFRKEFLDQMVEGHENAIDKLEKHAQDENVKPEVKTYIDGILPTLKQHLETAKQLQNKQ